MGNDVASYCKPIGIDREQGFKESQEEPSPTVVAFVKPSSEP